MRRLLPMGLLALWFAGTAFPQCTMCREAAASQDERGVRVFNAAIVVLGAPPAIILGGIGWFAYRRRDG